jgi:flagellar basal-body rod modification protein FlgD
MSSVAQILNNAGVVKTGQAGTTPHSSNLGGDEFMTLLLAQLRNQNPLEPLGEKDMIGQMTQLNSLQELQKMNANLTANNRSNRLTEAAGLIGKRVEYMGGKEGLVTGVSYVQDEIMLWIGDQTAPLSSVTAISEPGGKSA